MNIITPVSGVVAKWATKDPCFFVPTSKAIQPAYLYIPVAGPTLQFACVSFPPFSGDVGGSSLLIAMVISALFIAISLASSALSYKWPNCRMDELEHLLVDTGGVDDGGVKAVRTVTIIREERSLY